MDSPGLLIGFTTFMTVLIFGAVMTGDSRTNLRNAPLAIGLTAMHVAVNVEPQTRVAVGDFYTRFARVCWPIGM